MQDQQEALAAFLKTREKYLIYGEHRVAGSKAAPKKTADKGAEPAAKPAKVQTTAQLVRGAGLPLGLAGSLSMAGTGLLMFRRRKRATRAARKERTDTAAD
jgi:hypothetical protein